MAEHLCPRTVAVMVGGGGWWNQGPSVQSHFAHPNLDPEHATLSSHHVPTIDPLFRIFCTAEPTEDFVVVIMQANKPQLLKWAAQNDKTDLDFGTLLKDSDLHRAILADFDRLQAEANAPKQEFVKRVRVVADEWTPGNGLLTTSMKINRKGCRDHYRCLIDEMYASEI